MKFASFVFLLVLFVPAWASATEQEQESSCLGDCISANSWAVGLALGIGEYSNPLHHQDDRNVAFLPSFYYYGENFYIENATLGYTFYETNNWSLDIKSQFNNDGFFYNESVFDGSLASGMDISLFPIPTEVDAADFIPEQAVERDLSYLAGFGADYFVNDKWQFSLDILTDVSGVHHGQEVNLSTSYGMVLGPFKIGAMAAVSWRSRELNNYYYGFDNEEFEMWDVEYEAGSGINSQFELSAGYPISEHFSLVARYQYTAFSDEISHSSLVKDDHTHFYFFGIAGHIGSD